MIAATLQAATGQDMNTYVQTIDHGRIREVRLARPPVNALDTGLCRALIAALDAAVSGEAEAVVLSGAPGIFSAGLDVPHLLSLGQDRHALHAAGTARGAHGFLGGGLRGLLPLPPAAPGRERVMLSCPAPFPGVFATPNHQGTERRTSQGLRRWELPR